MPAKDIALEVLASDLPLYLGRDATARPADHKVLTSYFQAVTILNSTRMAGTPTWRSHEFMLPLAEYGSGLRCPPPPGAGQS